VSKVADPPRVLRLFTDGAARGNPGPAGIGLVIEDGSGARLWGGCAFLGKATNNQAEYEALIAGLRKAVAWNPDRVDVYLDSQLVVEQMTGRWKIKDPQLQTLAAEAKRLLNSFPAVQVKHVPRTKNSSADALANRAIDEHQQKGSGKGVTR
jgi:ribonuclease HI